MQRQILWLKFRRVCHGVDEGSFCLFIRISLQIIPLLFKVYRGRRARKRYAVEIAAVRAEIERKKRPPAVEGKPSKAPSKAKALSNQIEDGVVIQSLDNMFGELKVLEDSLETLQDESQRINKEANRAGINELKRGELQKQAGLMRYLEKSEQNRLAQARNAIAAAGADQQEYSVEFPTELGALLKTSKPVFVGPLPASAQSYMLNTSKRLAHLCQRHCQYSYNLYLHDTYPVAVHGSSSGPCNHQLLPPMTPRGQSLVAFISAMGRRLHTAQSRFLNRCFV